MLGGKEERFAQAEPVEIGVVAAGVVKVDLVHHKQHRLVLASQALRDPLVERGHSVLRVDDEEDDLGGVDGELHLHLGRGHDLRRTVSTLEADAAGIEQRVGAVFNLGGDHIARDARLVMHDGNALPRQPVEEAAFADIRPADDGDDAGHKR